MEPEAVEKSVWLRRHAAYRAHWSLDLNKALYFRKNTALHLDGVHPLRLTGKYGPTVTAQEIGSWSNWVDTPATRDS
jgi:hypothetical protein